MPGNIKESTKNDGKKAWVFGGSEGIGLSIAEALAASGAEVIIISRNIDKLEKAVDTINVSTGRRVDHKALDICDYQTTRDVIDTLVAQRGTPDWVINCAGSCRPGYFKDLKPEHFEQMMALNLMGTVHVCKAIEPHFRSEKKGHIVNTASIAGFIPLFGYTGYSASKYAVKGFSRALRIELKPFNIKVSLLCPPNTNTPGLDAENLFKPQAVLDAEEKLTPMDPETVAQIVLKKLDGNPWLIIPGKDGWLAYVVNRISTRLINWLVRRPLNSI